MKMAEYMMDHIGEEFTGMISGVTSFGMFVELPNMIEGLVHITDIKGATSSNILSKEYVPSPFEASLYMNL